MEAVRIRSLSDVGKKGIVQMRKECSTWVVRWGLKKLQTQIHFNGDEVTIKNPAMQFTDGLEHEKSQAGLKQIIQAYKEMGAVEGKDFIIEVVN